MSLGLNAYMPRPFLLKPQGVGPLGRTTMLSFSTFFFKKNIFRLDINL